MTIRYELELEFYRKIWLGYFYESLSNMLVFWGIVITGGIGLAYIIADGSISILMLCIFVSLPFYMIYWSYQSFMKSARNAFFAMTDEERLIEITFINGAQGFNSQNDQNTGYTAWKSIKGVRETKDCFIFNRLGGIFYVPKSAFRDNSEIGFLRYLISTNVAQNVRMLEEG